MLEEFKFLFKRLPFYLIFYPTSKCNAHCLHCFNYKRQNDSTKSKDLSIDEIDKISKSLGHIKVLTLTGGEPFLRKDLPEIVSLFHKNNGVQYLSLHTNAFLGNSVYDTVCNIINSSPGIQIIVCISIDFLKESHDKYRNVENGFHKILETIGRLKELKNKYKKLNLITTTIFSRSTMETFEDTIKFIQEDIKVVRPSLSFIRGEVKDELEKDVDFRRYRDFYRNFNYKIDNNIRPFSLMAVKEAIEMVVNKIVVDNYQYKRQTIPCQAGRRLIVIYENGDVYPCEILKENFGNLREVNYDVNPLLFSKKGRQITNKIQQRNSCYCTWENIIPVNLLYSPMYYPDILYKWLKIIIAKKIKKVIIHDK